MATDCSDVVEALTEVLCTDCPHQKRKRCDMGNDALVACIHGIVKFAKYSYPSQPPVVP